MGTADLSVAILAGGLGTRLQPVVADRPKVLASVAGRPYLSYLLDQLGSAGVREVVLLVGYRAEMVRSALGDSYDGLRLVYCVEPSPLGTAGAILEALPLLPATTLLVLNGDSYCDFDLTAFHAFHQRQQAGLSLLLTHVPNTERFGRVQVTQDQVERFEEKGASAGPGWINAGVYLLQRDLLASLPPTRPLSLERDAFPAWVERAVVRGYPSRGRFLDIGTPESYSAAQAFFTPHGTHAA